MFYHYAFVALSVAMFGDDRRGSARLPDAAAVPSRPACTSGSRLSPWRFPSALVVSFLTQLCIPFRVRASVAAVYGIVFTYTVISVPFVLSGIAICLALTGFPDRFVSRLYAADLVRRGVGVHCC